MRHSISPLLLSGLLLLPAACGGDDPGSNGDAAGAETEEKRLPVRPELSTNRNPPPPEPETVDTKSLDLPPAERVEIDGLAGFSTKSLVEFDQLRGRILLYETTHVFPDRARHVQEVNDQPELMQLIEYRFGGHAYRKEKDFPVSNELTGESRKASLRIFDARVAAFMWPHGYDWQEAPGDPDTRVADLEYGSLHMTIENGQPKKVETRNEQGTPETSLVIDAWQKIEERVVPLKIYFMAGEQIIWREVVRSFETRVNVKDTYFLPVDYQEVGIANTSMVQIAPIPAATFRRFELEDGTDWLSADRKDADLRAEVAGQGLPLSSRRTYEVGADGLPTAILLRLDGPTGASLPEGWETVSERYAVTLFVNSRDGLAPKLTEMATRVPEDAAAHPAYATFDPTTDAGGWIQLVLPYGPQ